jgi:hypothetical protein
MKFLHNTAVVNDEKVAHATAVVQRVAGNNRSPHIVLRRACANDGRSYSRGNARRQARPSFSLRPASTVEWTIRFLPCSLDCGKTYEAHVGAFNQYRFRLGARLQDFAASADSGHT